MSLVMWFVDDEDKRVPFYFPDLSQGTSGGIQPNLSLAKAVSGINSQTWTGRCPDSTAFANTWNVRYDVLDMPGSSNFFTYPGTASVTDTDTLSLTNNRKWTYTKNGRYVKNVSGVVKVYDSDDTELYSGEPTITSGFRIEAYQIPKEIPSTMTLAQFRSACIMGGMNPYTWSSDEPSQPIRWQAGTQSIASANHDIDWLYYILHDDSKDITVDDEDDRPDDPYDPYNPSGIDPGVPDPGNPYDPGDPISEPSLPAWNVSDSGFLKIFIPSSTTLNLLSSKLWDSNFFENLNKYIADPRDAIISLGCVPFNVTPSGTAEIKVGSIGTGVNSAYVDNSYVNIDCGSVTINPIIGAYTDYAPYTQLMLVLPYVGSVQLDTDIYMEKTINVKYHVDIVSGDCIAYIICNGNVKATYNGNMRFDVPITSADFRQAWSTFLSVTTGAMLGAAGAAAAGAEAGAMEVTQGASKGRVGKLSQGAGIKPDISMTGQLPSTNGLLGMQKPFIQIRRPNLCIPDSQKTIEGYPSLLGASIGSFSGYCEIEEVHLSIPGAYEEELDEIERLLKEGVIL